MGRASEMKPRVPRFPVREAEPLLLSLALLGAVGALVYLPLAAAPVRPPDGPIAHRDGRGRDVRPPAPARRFVSLMPSFTELVFDAGAGDLLVGVTRACDHPPEARAIPKAGDVVVDYERTVAMRPDVVLSSHMMMQRPNAILETLGLRVYAADPETWEEIAGLLRTIGRMAGRPERGDEAAARLLRRVESIRKGRARAAFVELSPHQTLAAGGGSIPDLALRTAGGTNVFAGLGRPWDWVEWEAVLRADPDVLIVPIGASRVLETRPGGERLRGRVFEIDPDLLVRPGPRLVRGAELLAERFR